MFTFLTVLIVILSVLLIFIVTIQESKGGGLASGFSSNNQIMGVRKTTDFLEKATWTLIGAIVVLSVLTTHFIPKNIDSRQESVLEEALPKMPATPTDVAPFGQPEDQAQPVTTPTEPSEPAENE